MTITEKEAIAQNGKYLHRVGSDSYFTRCTLLAGETAESFEEVDTIPPVPEEPLFDYNEEVNGRIRERYSESEEFAILRQRDSKPEEFSVYNEYCEQCKAEVKTRLAGGNL